MASVSTGSASNISGNINNPSNSNNNRSAIRERTQNVIYKTRKRLYGDTCANNNNNNNKMKDNQQDILNTSGSSAAEDVYRDIEQQKAALSRSSIVQQQQSSSSSSGNNNNNDKMKTNNNNKKLHAGKEVLLDSSEQAAMFKYLTQRRSKSFSPRRITTTSTNTNLQQPTSIYTGPYSHENASSIIRATRSNSPLIYRQEVDDESSITTGISQQDLIRKKVKNTKNRKEAFGRNKNNNSKRKPVIQLPASLLLRTSNKTRQSSSKSQRQPSYYVQTIEGGDTSMNLYNNNDDSTAEKKGQQQQQSSSITSSIKLLKSASSSLQSKHGGNSEEVSTAETSNVSGESSNNNVIHIDLTTKTTNNNNKKKQTPILTIRGDDVAFQLSQADDLKSLDSFPVLSSKNSGLLLHNNEQQSNNNHRKVSPTTPPQSELQPSQNNRKANPQMQQSAPQPANNRKAISTKIQHVDDSTAQLQGDKKFPQQQTKYTDKHSLEKPTENIISRDNNSATMLLQEEKELLAKVQQIAKFQQADAAAAASSASGLPPLHPPTRKAAVVVVASDGNGTSSDLATASRMMKGVRFAAKIDDYSVTTEGEESIPWDQKLDQQQQKLKQTPPKDNPQQQKDKSSPTSVLDGVDSSAAPTNNNTGKPISILRQPRFKATPRYYDVDHRRAIAFETDNKPVLAAITSSSSSQPIVRSTTGVNNSPEGGAERAITIHPQTNNSPGGGGGRDHATIYPKTNHPVTKNVKSHLDSKSLNTSAELSPPRSTAGAFVDKEGLELSPIHPNFIIDKSTNSQRTDTKKYHPINNNNNHHHRHTNEQQQHLQAKMATVRGMHGGGIAGRVIEQEQYPDPPIEINMDDDETVSSAYIFIETVACIVIQTAIRRFLAQCRVIRILEETIENDLKQQLLHMEKQQTIVEDSHQKYNHWHDQRHHNQRSPDNVESAGNINSDRILHGNQRACRGDVIEKKENCKYESEKNKINYGKDAMETISEENSSAAEKDKKVNDVIDHHHDEQSTIMLGDGSSVVKIANDDTTTIEPNMTEAISTDFSDEVGLDMFILAAIQIQACWRGFWVRDCLDVDHYCAAVIQKTYRSYKSRKESYDDLWKIILVQSWWRRNLAREEAANILAYAIILQSAFRGFSVRKRYRKYLKRRKRRDMAATKIQSAWRGFVCEATYIRFLVDVLIVQTVVRRWLAIKHINRTNQSCQSSVENNSLRDSTPESKIAVVSQTWQRNYKEQEQRHNLSPVALVTQSRQGNTPKLEARKTVSPVSTDSKSESQKDVMSQPRLGISPKQEPTQTLSPVFFDSKPENKKAVVSQQPKQRNSPKQEPIQTASSISPDNKPENRKAMVVKPRMGDSPKQEPRQTLSPVSPDSKPKSKIAMVPQLPKLGNSPKQQQKMLQPGSPDCKQPKGKIAMVPKIQTQGSSPKQEQGQTLSPVSSDNSKQENVVNTSSTRQAKPSSFSRKGIVAYPENENTVESSDIVANPNSEKLMEKSKLDERRKPKGVNVITVRVRDRYTESTPLEDPPGRVLKRIQPSKKSNGKESDNTRQTANNDAVIAEVYDRKYQTGAVTTTIIRVDRQTQTDDFSMPGDEGEPKIDVMKQIKNYTTPVVNPLVVNEISAIPSDEEKQNGVVEQKGNQTALTLKAATDESIKTEAFQQNDNPTPHIVSEPDKEEKLIIEPIHEEKQHNEPPPNGKGKTSSLLSIWKERERMNSMPVKRFG